MVPTITLVEVSMGHLWSKSEKWLGVPPKPNFDSWSTREGEVIGWSQYLVDLASWAAQASIEFSTEIQQSARWHSAITLDGLSPARRARAMRLNAILKSTLQEHARTANLINAFGEGVSLDESCVGLNLQQLGNGFELLRQLTVEYSLRTRAEALAIRSQFASRSFVRSSKETSPTSIVSDVIRRLDLESARFNKLLATLPATVDVVGLQLSDADLLIILMRSLPDAVKSYTIHHSLGESYQSYRAAARRWEMQQRLFLEQVGGNGAKERRVNEVSSFAGSPSNEAGSSNTEWFLIGDESGLVDAISTEKCQKCGSRKHTTPNCHIDLSKTKCFRCQQFGHVGTNCPSGKGKNSHDGPSTSKGKGKVNKGGHWDRGKGKSKKGKSSKGFGKKGKLNQVEAYEDDLWWYADEWTKEWDDSDWSWNVAQVDWNDNGWNEWSYYGNEDSGVGSKDPKSDSPAEGTAEASVGSLVIHALTSDEFLSEDTLGQLWLHDGCDVCNNDAFSQEVSGFSHGFDFSEMKGHFSEVSDLGFGFEKPTSTPFFLPGLMHGGELGHAEGTRVDVSELLSPEPRRYSLWRPQISTSLSHPDSVDGTIEFSKYLEHVCPILSELSCSNDAGWWLLDSGAAVTVVSEAHFPLFQAKLIQSQDVDRFRAANGSKVVMKGIANIVLGFSMLNPQTGKSSWKTATLQAMVGNTNHNILSTTALCRSGWQFSQWDGGAELKHGGSGEVVAEIVEHSGCPWIRMIPSPSDHTGSFDEPNVSTKTDLYPIQISPLSPAVEAQLEQHRRQGHFPHHPQCVDCAKGRSVFQHRRRGLQNIECEVQADFAFITKKGEVSEEDSRRSTMKVLVLTELLSGCVGFVVVSDNLVQVNSDIEKWLDSFGLTSSITSVILHTDDEKAVGDLVTKATRKYLFQIRRAAPQQHRSIGAAERAVRKLKESLSVLRADLNKHGVDVRFSFSGLRDVVTYLALMNNHFGRAGGTDLSPLETSAGRSLSKPTVSMFGSLVVAEIPDSIRQYSPNETRSVEAAFVHPGLGTGSAVEGFLRVDGRLELRRFYARNVRPVSPLQWNQQLCQNFIFPLDLPDIPLPPLDDPELGSGPVQDGEAVGEPSEAPREGPGVEGQPDSPWYTPTTPSYGSEHYGSEFARDESPLPPPSPSRTSSARKGDRKRSVRFEDQESDEPDKKKKKTVFTRGCPSCETGMNAPGIRHNATCRRAQAAAESSPAVFQPDDDIPGDGESQRSSFQSQKRSSDTAVEDLEEEIRTGVDEDGDTTMDMISSIGLFWTDSGEPLRFPTLSNLTSVTWATSPDTFDEFVQSIKFLQEKESKSEKVNLCGTDVLLWMPHEVVDDTTLVLLDPDLTFAGMSEELANMSKCKVGQVMEIADVEKLKISCPHLRVIQARWVTAFKAVDRVRARVVAKDIRSKESARALGCSSPTPSCEVVQILLSIASTRGWRLRALDVSRAFMHSPLPEKTRVVLRMPKSISSLSGEVIFLDLWKSLNGLRDASMHWLSLLTSTITKLGLWNDEYEPCCFQGQVVNGREVLGSVVMIVYVDDILITSSSKAAEERVVQSIAAIVPTKTTGVVLPSALGGGSLCSLLVGQLKDQKGKSAFCCLFPPSISSQLLMNFRSKSPGPSLTFLPIWRKLTIYPKRS